MKYKLVLTFIVVILLLGCNNKDAAKTLNEQYSGRYLFNSNELIEVYFKNNEPFIKWRGAEEIKPIYIDVNTYYVKEMNEKILFNANENNSKIFLEFLPKQNSDTLVKRFYKLDSTQFIPNEFLQKKDFNKALEAFMLIKKNDSLDLNIQENFLNQSGYRYLRDGNFEMAVNIFKINAKLYPESANVYDSLGEALLKSGDTLNAILNYKKSLTLDSGNLRAKRTIERLDKNN
jgi:hypothetical protein